MHLLGGNDKAIVRRAEVGVPMGSGERRASGRSRKRRGSAARAIRAAAVHEHRDDVAMQRGADHVEVLHQCADGTSATVRQVALEPCVP